MDIIRSLFGKGIKDAATEKKQDKLAKKSGLQSGAAKSSDGKIAAGWANTRGKRWYNEDETYCAFHPVQPAQPKEEEPTPPINSDTEVDANSTAPAPAPATNGSGESVTQVGCFGCFDGHGGAAASAFVRTHLFDNMMNHEAFPHNLAKAIDDAYQETDDQYLSHDEQHRNDDGTTAVTAVVYGKKLVVAHVGDSRAVMYRGGKVIPLSDDHKPNREDERERIENVGGTVVHMGTWRVSGVLAVSRSFGNRTMKQFIVPHPEIREEELSPDTKCVILATDGVWDVLKNEDAVQVAMRCSSDAEQAAKAVVTAAYDRGSMDNISALVVFFKL